MRDVTTMRRFSSTPLMELPATVLWGKEDNHLPHISGIATEPTAKRRLSLRPSCITGMATLANFGVCAYTVGSDSKQSPLSSRRSCFHVSDLWSQRQQKQFLRLLAVDHTMLVRRKHQQVLSYKDASATHEPTALSVFTSHLVRSSILVTTQQPESTNSRVSLDSSTVNALVSPRGKRKRITARQRLSRIDRFIDHLDRLVKGRKDVGTACVTLRIPEVNGRPSQRSAFLAYSNTPRNLH